MMRGRNHPDSTFNPNVEASEGEEPEQVEKRKVRNQEWQTILNTYAAREMSR